MWPASGVVWGQSPDPQAAIQALKDSLRCSAPGPSATVIPPIRLTLDGDYIRSIGAPPPCYFPVPEITNSEAGAVAKLFMSQHLTAFVSPGPTTFDVLRQREGTDRFYVRLQQLYNRVPVYGGEVIVQVGYPEFQGPKLAATAEIGIESVNAVMLRDLSSLNSGAVPTRPAKTSEKAQQAAIAWMVSHQEGTQHEITSAPVLMIFAPSVLGFEGDVRLVWKMNVRATDGSLFEEEILVDAVSGEVVFHFTTMEGALDREVYDANNVKGTNPGTLERDEGDPASSIADVNGIYDNFGATYNFYSNEHGRDSVDNAGLTMSATARYCPADPPAPKPPAACPMRNAFWSGSGKRMYFGDGYALDDVTGHELTHGVTQFESGLKYQNQSGAINESFSDIWGEFIDQVTPTGNDAANVKWLMGEDLPGGAIRSMKDPTLYNDPDRMGSPLLRPNVATPDDSNDQGGVHTNSGVGNKLAYLLAEGDTFNGHTVSGMGNSTTADLFYEAQTNLLNSSSDYADLGTQLTQAAINLGWSQAQQDNLREALCAVEIVPNGCANDVTACIFDDHNANGVKDAGETNVSFIGWGFTWDGGCGGSQTITQGRCVRLFGQQAPGTYNITLNVNDTNCKFDDPTGNGKRWQLTTAKTVALNVTCGLTTTVEFGVVELGTITVRKFDDADMNKAKGVTESYLSGWPIRLDGPTAPLCPPTWPQNGVTEAKFVDLPPGNYTIKEDLPWETVQPCATDPSTVNRVTFQGKRWQATTGIEQAYTLAEGDDAVREFGNVCLGTITACAYYDRNMSGSRQAVAENFTDTNSNGKWDPAELFGDINHNGIWDAPEPYVDSNHNGRYDSGEPFTDLNGSLCWDDGEPLRDENGNGVWDPAEPWVDTFANGVWDAAEELLPNWPMAVCGTSADGKCVGPIAGSTDASGCVTLKDIPPGNFQVYQDSVWCGGKVDWCNGGAMPPVDQCKTTYNGRRWLATTAITNSLQMGECEVLSSFEFGTVCLATITGNLSLKNCPDDIPTPLGGWQVCLTQAYVEPTITFAPLPTLATNPDCVNLAGNCTTTLGDGSFRFGELVPGVYLARETPQVGYNPMGSPVDLCVPYRISCEDIDKQLEVRDINSVCPLYQAYPTSLLAAVEGPPEEEGPGEGVALAQLGNGIGYLNPVWATAGVFSIDPGSKWGNFVNAMGGCVPYCLKNVTLTKEHFALRQCTDVFPAGVIHQQGTRNIRTWWPLLYESPGTTWTLNILYGTSTPVQLPGEAVPGVVHSDQWKWQVQVTLESLDLLLDVFHSVPFGTDEVGLISDEQGYLAMKSLVAAAASAGNNQQRMQALSDLELLTADMCISASPALPRPSGPGLGIAQTKENPAGCKVMADLDYLLKQYGKL
ncbi:MAG: M4 family metallopeptidase [Armatimonadetes bacterium]|nr:M4 family metallopeptidase [Armatimonadota bacterium]